MKPHITRIAAHKLAKVILHEICDRIGHYPFQSGYSYTCDGQKVAVKSATFVESRAAWVWWVKKIDADKIMFVAFGRDLAVEHVWLMPVSVVRADGRFLVREDSVDVWDEYEIDNSKFKNLL
jgi:hypothetical protein